MKNPIENSTALEKIRADGTRVPIKLNTQGPSLGIFMPLVLPGGKKNFSRDIFLASVSSNVRSSLFRDDFPKEIPAAVNRFFS